MSSPCRCLIECRDEYKYNVEAVELLIRNHLVNMQQYDLHLAQVNFQDINLCVRDFLYFIFDSKSETFLLFFLLFSRWKMDCTTWQLLLPCSW